MFTRLPPAGFVIFIFFHCVSDFVCMLVFRFKSSSLPNFVISLSKKTPG